MGRRRGDGNEEAEAEVGFPIEKCRVKVYQLTAAGNLTYINMDREYRRKGIESIADLDGGELDESEADGD